MSTHVVFTGITERQAELIAQPEAMAKATQSLARRIARQAAADIKAAYPKRSGRLRDGVQVVERRTPSRTVAAATVVNTNPLTHNFEHGTQARHTKQGLDRGRMPAGNVFIPRMIRWRFTFFQAVKEIMEYHGITVTGGY